MYMFSLSDFDPNDNFIIVKTYLKSNNLEYTMKISVDLLHSVCACLSGSSRLFLQPPLCFYFV